MSKSLVKDMTTGNPAKLILKFAIPMLIGNIFQQFYNMVDSIVVGKFVGHDALAAVGATGPLNFFIFALSFGLSAGISIVISQFYGAKDYENVKKSFATATYIIVGSAMITGVLGFIGSRWLLRLLNTPESIIDQSDLYMKIIFAGILGVTCYNGMSSVLRALGDSVTPLIFLAVASLLNVVLDLVFVVSFGWGVPGVAIATIISQILAAIGCILYAFKKVKLLHMPLKEFRPDKFIFSKCIKLGLPVAIQNALISISTMALQGVINSFGEIVIASATAASRIEQLILQPGMSVGVAVASFTGQNIGANQIERAKKGFYAASKIILIFSLIMLPVIYFGGKSIMMLFTSADDTQVVEIGVEAIRVTCFFYSFVGMIFVSRSFLSGAGDVKIPMVMGFTEVVTRVVISQILSIPFRYHGIWWATALTWFFTCFVGIFRFYSGKWKDKSIIRG
ncbi:MAG: putative rane protein [Herbinix sp.]|jgi:putative MATE family efflux protein|nr:putative rane protein [Herbinix sp.]